MDEKVVDFTEFRKKRAEELGAAPSVEQMAKLARERIEEEWEKFAKSNRLNDYVVNFLPSWMDPSANYLGDLNKINEIESKLGVVVIVKSPQDGAVGWRAAFVLKSGTFETPDMPFESYARCFNFLYFLRLKRDLLVNGMIDAI